MTKSELKAFAEGSGLIVHNAQFEHRWFLNDGINANILHDTYLMARLIDNRMPADLESLCLRYGIDKAYKLGSVVDFKGKELHDRVSRDAYNTYKLYEVLYPQLSEREKSVYKDVLLPATKTLAQIELEGLCVDMGEFDSIRSELDSRILELNLEEEPCIREFNSNSDKPFNISSDVHKAIVIYDLLGYTPIKTTATGYSTDAETLEAILALSHRGHKGGIEDCPKCSPLHKLVTYSKLTGWKENFLESIARHVIPSGDRGFLYTDLRCYGAATGRVISTNPNLQNTPNNWTRRLFIPRYDELWEADYKGIELRIWACLAQDDKLIDAFKTGDPHVSTAIDIFNKKTISDEERHAGKTLNYLIVNGGGAGRMARLLGIDIKDAYVFLKRFWKAHPSGQDFWERYVEGDTVISPTGMKRYFDRDTQARNHLIQNPALVMLLAALNEAVFHIKREGACIDLTIHDSVRLDATKKLGRKLVYELKEIMEAQTPDWMELPLEVSLKRGNHWGQMEDV